jgi:hypothetical protein
MINTNKDHWKYFFWAAGILTTLGALPTMISPKSGPTLSMGLSYADQSPQMVPIVGHWGIMVVGMGILLFASARIKHIRRSTVIFSTVEKSYMVSLVIYNFIRHAPFAGNYTIVLIGDSLMVIGGIWYLLTAKPGAVTVPDA